MLVRRSWTPGPAERFTGERVATLTAFRADRWSDVPGVWQAGLALRTRWPHLDGAVGMWLWGQIGTRTCGSVSMWTDEAALRRFVGCPDHLTVVRRYRTWGELRSVTWTGSPGPAEQVWRQARRTLTDHAFWGEAA